MTRTLPLRLAMSALVLLPSVAAGSASFRILQPQSPYTTIDIRAVSPDGKHLIGSLGNNTVLRATRWSTSDLVPADIGLISGLPFSDGIDLSHDGSVGIANALTSAYSPRPFLTHSGGGKTSLPLPPGTAFAYATDISSDGSVVAGWTNLNNRSRLWRWSAATGTVLDGMPAGYLDLQFSSLMSGNARYTVMGATRFDSLTQTALDIGRLFNTEGVSSSAPSILSISHDGSAVSGTIRELSLPGGMYSGSIAFRWTESTGIIPLAPPDGAHNYTARFISGDGSTILGSDNGTPYVWTEQTGIRPLSQILAEHNLPDFGLDYFDYTGLSHDGKTLVGRAQLPTGPTVGWVLTLPIPEPAQPITFLLLIAAVLTRSRR